MAKFTDGMSGWQRLLLVFGLLAAALAALRFIPTETGTLLTWVSDQIRTIFAGGTP